MAGQNHDAARANIECQSIETGWQQLLDRLGADGNSTLSQKRVAKGEDDGSDALQRVIARP